MAIRITRNETGNCINFIGSTNPAYWNACLSAQINEQNPNGVDVINDIISAQEPSTVYEFHNVNYTEFADKDGVVFENAQAAVDYINSNANVTGLSSEVGSDMTGVDINFRLDETNTTVLLDNGFSYAVNSIKAIAHTDGTIHINAIATGKPTDGTETDRKHLERIEVGRVYVNGTVVAGGISTIVNTLNELFTVGPFEAVVISDPLATMVADVDGVAAGYTLEGNTATDPIGDDIFTNSSSGNYAGLLSTATIDQAGEYFTFDIRGEAQIGFGLVHTEDSYNDGHFTGTSIYANPASFAVSNSAHYGFQFSHWFHPTPNGSWTNYGASTGFIYGPGWHNWESRDEWLAGSPVKVRVGIDELGFIAISTLQDDGTTWVLHARTSYPVKEGAEFRLGIKAANSSGRVFTEPKVHLLEPDAPTLNFRWIESPDGNYQYPLFATEEEANYYDANHDNGVVGTGTSHTHIFADDPTGTTWYMPDTGSTMTDTEDPSTGFGALSNSFMGQAVNWTEVTSLSNADLTPPVFTGLDLTVNEGDSVNYQTQPQDTAYSTSISGLPLGLLSFAGSINGTAPEVTGDNVTNPSDTYTVTVTRTNSYGSSSGTFDIIVNNTTAPTVTAITGFTHEATSTALVDSDTMDDGSAISITEQVGDGERLVIDKEWLDRNVFPAIRPGTGAKRVKIGFASNNGNPSEDWTTFQSDNYWIHYEFYVDDSTRQSNNWRLKPFVLNNPMNNVGVGGLSLASPGLYDLVFINDGGDAKMGALVASQNHDASSKVFDTTDSAWNWEYTQSTGTVGPKDIYIHIDNCQMDFDTNGLNEYSEPVASTTLTNWNKALDFDGSSERAMQVDSSHYRVPMKMANVSTTVLAGAVGMTSNDSNSRPWATMVVFKADTYNSNQHVWNLGEGSGDADDNIYLRRDANRNLWFGWGRSGAVNECKVADINSTMSSWHGVYIAHNGARLSGGHSAADIANCFDIRYTNSNAGWSMPTNNSTEANWTAGSFGARMDRSVGGYMTIGGRGANRSFRGKVASFVQTTLRRGVAMPTTPEIEEMLVDPKKWLNDYKVGTSFRLPWQAGNLSNFQINDGSSAYSCAVWLMGDGTSDSYSNMIRNQVHPSDQNYTKLNMISMVSNDIQNVTINGLT